MFSTLQYLQSGEKAPHQSTIEIEMFLTLIEKVYFELDTLITVGIVSGKVDTSDWGSSLALSSTKHSFTCANYLHFDFKTFAGCFIISEFNALPMLPRCQRGR